MTARRTAIILTISSNDRNVELLIDFLREEGYNPVTANTIEMMDRLIAETPDIALAVLDIEGFSATLWDRCVSLRSSNIPVLILAQTVTDTIRSNAIRLGVVSILTKPVKMGDLAETIDSIVGSPRS